MTASDIPFQTLIFKYTYEFLTLTDFLTLLPS